MNIAGARLSARHHRFAYEFLTYGCVFKSPKANNRPTGSAQPFGVRVQQNKCANRSDQFAVKFCFVQPRADGRGGTRFSSSKC